MSEQPSVSEPTADLESALQGSDVEHLEMLVRNLASGELARAVSRLDPEQRSTLLTTLPRETAAFVVDQLAHAQAADLLETLPPDAAAAIIDELPSDEQADVLGEFRESDAQAIIEQMAPEEAEDARLLTRYKPNTAGGLMVTEYLAFFESMTVDDVLHDIRANADRYLTYDVQYLYVIDSEGRLRGVVRLRDLVLARPSTELRQIMIRDPDHVRADDDLDALEGFFDTHDYFGVPVVDEDDRLVGVVRHEAVEEARGDRADIALLRFGGIIAGEEFRTMPLFSRAGRRLVFLMPNILLNLVSVSVIAFFEPTIAKVTALAIFLPILSDMSGCSGNQAVAVSMRELSLGLVKPADALRTLGKEVGVGLINGLILGIILAVIATVMRGDQFVWIGVIVGGALAANSIIAVCIGGTVPLLLKGLKLDPAMASSSILTTITDICGFFFALGLATLILM
ncbi:MAG: magnesium transporter [Phycisphaeraceae bacterium]